MLLPPAPAHFTPALGIEWARLSAAAPPFVIHGPRKSGRRLEGLKYERRVHEHFLAEYPGLYTPGPWMYYKGTHGVKWCQSDGLIFDFERGAIILIEIKYQHTTDAWWQMRRLYEPVLRELFPPALWTIHALEVVKWYDPQVPWPESLRLLQKPLDAVHLNSTTTGVHICKP
jgi:hypothetical protein